MNNWDTKNTIKFLNDKADQYEKNGEPGPLGLNCWGWRQIAKELRETAYLLKLAIKVRVK